MSNRYQGTAPNRGINRSVPQTGMVTLIPQSFQNKEFIPVESNTQITLTKLSYYKLQSVAQQELKIIRSTKGESKAPEKQLDAGEMQETLEYIENKAASN